MLQRVLYDPILQDAVRGSERRLFIALAVLFLLSIMIRRVMFGRASSDLMLFPSMLIGALIAIGIANFNSSVATAQQLTSPFTYPPDTHLVYAYAAASLVLALVFGSLVAMQRLRARRPATPQSHSDDSALQVRSPIVQGGPFGWVYRLGIFILAAVGGVSVVNWTIAPPTYSVDYVRNAVLAPDASMMWTVIRGTSLADFDRLTEQLAAKVAAPGTTDGEMKLAMDDVLTGYQAEFATSIGAVSDRFAKDYLLRRIALLKQLSPTTCARLSRLGTNALTAEEIQKDRSSIEDFMTLNLRELQLVKQAARPMPASFVQSSDWWALMHQMNALGSEHANLDYIFRTGPIDETYCREHIIFLKALVDLDTYFSAETRNAIVGDMMTGVGWNWATKAD